MKKHILLLSLILFTVSMKFTLATDRYQGDFLYYLIEPFYEIGINGDPLVATGANGDPNLWYVKAQDIHLLPSYQPCRDFTKMQKKYQILQKFGFFIPDAKFNYYVAYLEHLANFAPKNAIQQALYPYWTDKYAKEGNGVQLFCTETKKGIFQMGSIQLQGSTVVKYKLVIAERDGITKEIPLQEVNFIVSSSPDKHLSILSYLTGEQNDVIPLGCIGEAYGKERFDGLSVNIDTITETFSINSLHRSPVAFSGVVDFFKKSAAYPEKEITINAQLTPNVIFDHGLDIPCENSRIQDIEIVDDGGL